MRKMYKILLGQMEPPDDVTPDFIREGVSEVGSTAQQALERLKLLRVGLLCFCVCVCVCVLCMHAAISQTCHMRLVSLSAQSDTPISSEQAFIWCVLQRDMHCTVVNAKPTATNVLMPACRRPKACCTTHSAYVVRCSEHMWDRLLRCVCASMHRRSPNPVSLLDPHTPGFACQTGMQCCQSSCPART